MLCCSVPVYSAVCLTREVIIYGRKKQKEKNTLHQNPRGAGKDSEEKEKKQQELKKAKALKDSEGTVSEEELEI